MLLSFKKTEMIFESSLERLFRAHSDLKGNCGGWGKRQNKSSE